MKPTVATVSPCPPTPDLTTGRPVDPMRILTATQMREADRQTIEDLGIPSIVLMENAGRQVVTAMEATFEDLATRRVAVLCGKGNNGGDGFVVARTLDQRGVEVAVFVIGRLASVAGDARLNLNLLGRLGLRVVEVADEQAWELHGSEMSRFDIIVDAMLGTGLSKPVAGMLQTVVADLNGSEIPVVSIDLPSGLSADAHDPIGPTVEAVLTVTLGAPKLPLVVPAGEACVGELVVADIGIPTQVIETLDGPRTEILSREHLCALVPSRTSGAHKGDFGRVLVVAGSVGKTGAARLTALGALRSGAGLVTVATPRSCEQTIAGGAPEYMSEGLDETPLGTVDDRALAQVLALRYDILAVGPGLGTGPGPTAFVHGLLERTPAPLVLDADALNAFVKEPERLQGRDDLDVIITPHPGEMARLMGVSVADVQADRIHAARSFAAEHHVYVILKGYRTVIASPGGAIFINLSGNPGMATGGTGDVLTGVLAGWLAQLLDAEAACKLSVYLHGRAGDLASAECGEVSLIATDILAHMGHALLDLTGPHRTKPEE